ncbi:MAG: hypothetical protein II874_03955 [Bacteroidales bacterium]|nr:hypothetical protein [Bacteroidales bacterium]
MAKKKKQITIEQAVSDCRALFNIPGSAHSKEEKGHFLIDKREFERFEVVNKLMDYFRDKAIIGGGCFIEPITLLWTAFTIKPLK